MLKKETMNKTDKVPEKYYYEINVLHIVTLKNTSISLSPT